MRSRPATWTALVWRNILWPISTHEAWGSSSFTRTPRSTRKTMPLDRSPSAKQTPQIDLQHYGGQRPVLPCVEDSVRRPQRPGNQFPRRNAFLEDPSRQFTLENCQEPPALPQCSGRARRTSRTDVSQFAPHTLAHQAKSRASLCRNCGWLRFLVESDGKTGRNFRPPCSSPPALIRTVTPTEFKFSSSL